MLLQSLRRSHTLARLVLAWFVFAMGVAVAAPTVQPLDLGSICSAVSPSQGGSAPDGNAPASAHHTAQCVLCLGVGAPPAVAMAAPLDFPGSTALNAVRDQAVVLAARQSPLVARAPPAR